MAKGLRSKVKKVNKQKLRFSVFGPVEEARKERLSTKLLELASKQDANGTATLDRIEKRKLTLNATKLACHLLIPAGPTNFTDCTLRSETSLGEEGRYRDRPMNRAYTNWRFLLAMELDHPDDPTVTKPQTPKASNRIQKRARSKAKAAMVFPIYKKGKRVGPHLSSRQRKQSLKPH